MYTNEPRIRVIERETNIAELVMHKLDWDVVVPQRLDPEDAHRDFTTASRYQNLVNNFEYNAQNGILVFRNGNWYHNRPYQVVSIEGYVHSIGGRHGINDLWMYPLDSAPDYDNLVEYDMDQPVAWGIRHDPHAYINARHGESESRMARGVMITRNGRDFMDIPGSMEYAISKAYHTIIDVQEGPLDVDSRDWDKKLVGRRIWYRGQPAVVERFIWGQGCIIARADGEPFVRPREYDDDCFWEPEDSGSVKIEITSRWIYWFRE